MCIPKDHKFLTAVEKNRAGADSLKSLVGQLAKGQWMALPTSDIHAFDSLVTLVRAH